jgi:hypothetical protein
MQEHVLVVDGAGCLAKNWCGEQCAVSITRAWQPKTQESENNYTIGDVCNNEQRLQLTAIPQQSSLAWTAHFL